jgi:hypothetical protein
MLQQIKETIIMEGNNYLLEYSYNKTGRALGLIYYTENVFWRNCFKDQYVLENFYGFVVASRLK